MVRSRNLSIMMCDFYKYCHMAQYDERIVKLVSYATPRGCRLPGKDFVINFGVQAFCKEYLIEHFNSNFFYKPDYVIQSELTEFLQHTLPGIDVESTVNKVLELHELGYLPISLRSLPEGTRVDLKCPNIELVTTNPKFAWIGGFIESLLSSYIWKPMIDATVAHWYRLTANKYYRMTSDLESARSAMSEFGFRGADSPESGVHSGAGWLLSFDKTATCASIPWINKYYNTLYSKSNAFDVTEYASRYHNHLVEINDTKKLNNELNNFMHENDMHNFNESNDSEKPDYIIPREEWNSSKELVCARGLIDRDNSGYEIYKVVPVDYSVVGKGLISTEHSVMCSSTQLGIMDGLNERDAEKSYIRKLLTEIYPKSSFSMVSDSYDYWRVVTELLPELKDEVLNHEGTLFVRGDSGNPIKIVSGYINIFGISSVVDSDKYLELGFSDEYEGSDLIKPGVIIPNELIPEFRLSDDSVIDMAEYGCLDDGKGNYYRLNYYKNIDQYVVGESIPSYEAKGTVACLWDTFNGSLNSKGYRVLNDKVRAIYGDSITQYRQEMIYKILSLKGYSVENVALGAGSFSFHAYEHKGVLYPFTRDTFNFAMKATYGELNTGESVMIYKDPKTDSDNFKRSMRGCCAVYTTETNQEGFFKHYLDQDGLTLDEREKDSNNRFIEVFRNGDMISECTFNDIREILNDGNF